MKIDIKNIDNEYFEWLYELVCGDLYSERISYRKLLMSLHSTEFIWTCPRDENRAIDGIELRQRFSEDLADYIEGPCSVLEMIIALAIRCEENIMDDTKYGDRTTQWFWKMINNLGLGDMVDTRFDKLYVKDTIQRFLYREYSPDGKGGLFVIRNCDYDVRDVEIWCQLMWYINTIN